MSACFGIKVKKTNTYKNKAIQQTEGHLECFTYCNLVLPYFVPRADSMAGKVKVFSSWGLWNWQIGSRLLLYMNSEHPDEHHGQPTRYNKKKNEYGCFATDLTRITKVSLYLTVSPDGGRQGDTATWLHLSLQSPLRGRWQYGCCLQWQIAGEEV